VTAPLASIVVAVLNEAENIGSVCDEALTALQPWGDFEIVFVDDGSTDDTAQRIAAIVDRDQRVRLVKHDRRCGKSQAVRTGVAAAQGTWVATIDGDGQNDPADLPAMLDLARNAEGRAPIVAGIRQRRNDPVSRLIATRIANGLRMAVLGDNCPDTGCGVKVFRREDFLLLPCFEGMHRFLPALFKRYEHPTINHPIKHRPRLAGQSKYTNWGRALVGIFDLLGVIWLLRRTRAPLAVTEDRRAGGAP
jgi:dolichol-phosphate mannosyltransferase